MFSFIKNWLNRRIINNSTMTQHDWDEAFSYLPLLKGFSESEIQKLKELTILFMHHKIFEGAQGVMVTPVMQRVISLQACLLVLNLSLERYENFVTIIIYPAGFITSRMVSDENGVVDNDRVHTTGEAWIRGPVILAWDDAEIAGKIDGKNLVIHEFAHKLDMQNGVANGFPPLHSNMRLNDWFKAFTKGYDHFERKCNGDKLYGISCYGVTSPAEFFAVFSEVFFERPAVLKKHYSDIHDLLELYYRQTPITRLE